jgi:hypothetical protein
MFVTLKVFKLIGPSNDGRRYGRGTYLFVNVVTYFKGDCDRVTSAPLTANERCFEIYNEIKQSEK